MSLFMFIHFEIYHTYLIKHKYVVLYIAVIQFCVFFYIVDVLKKASKSWHKKLLSFNNSRVYAIRVTITYCLLSDSLKKTTKAAKLYKFCFFAL